MKLQSEYCIEQAETGRQQARQEREREGSGGEGRIETEIRNRNATLKV